MKISSIDIDKEYEMICIDLSCNQYEIHCMINEFIHQILILITDKHENIISTYDNNYITNKTYMNINEKHIHLINILKNKLKIIKNNKNKYNEKFIRWIFNE